MLFTLRFPFPPIHTYFFSPQRKRKIETFNEAAQRDFFPISWGKRDEATPFPFGLGVGGISKILFLGKGGGVGPRFKKGLFGRGGVRGDNPKRTPQKPDTLLFPLFPLTNPLSGSKTRDMIYGFPIYSIEVREEETGLDRQGKP